MYPQKPGDHKTAIVGMDTILSYFDKIGVSWNKNSMFRVQAPDVISALLLQYSSFCRGPSGDNKFSFLKDKDLAEATWW